MNDALTQLEVQVAIPLLVAMIGIGLAWIKQHLNLQADSTSAQLEAVANDAIQTAVTNFAGKVSGALSTGALTRTTAVSQLRAYLGETVADSLTKLPVSDATLETMLAGKLAALAKVPAPVLAGV